MWCGLLVQMGGRPCAGACRWQADLRRSTRDIIQLMGTRPAGARRGVACDPSIQLIQVTSAMTFNFEIMGGKTQ